MKNLISRSGIFNMLGSATGYCGPDNANANPSHQFEVSGDVGVYGGVYVQGDAWALNTTGNIRFYKADDGSAHYCNLMGTTNEVGYNLTNSQSNWTIYIDDSSYGDLPDGGIAFYGGNPLENKMVITEAGQVGIGVTNPTDVYGRGMMIKATGVANSSTGNILFQSADATQNAYIRHIDSGVGTERLAVGVGGWGPSLEALSILNNKNVGVGVTLPSYNLEVTGIAQAESGRFTSLWITGSDGNWLQITGAGGGGGGGGGSAVWAEAGAEVTYNEGTSSTRKLGWGTAAPVAHIDLRVEDGNGGNIFLSPEPGAGRGFAGLPNNDDCNNTIIGSVASKMGRTESQEIFNNTILGGESLNITGSKNQPSEFNLLMGGSTSTIHNSTNSTAIANYGLISGSDYSLLLGGRSSKRPTVTGNYEAVLAFDNLIAHSGHKTLITGDADGGNLTVAGRVGIGTNGPACSLDAVSTIRAIEGPQVPPSAGAGLEMFYDSSLDAGYVLGFDRGAAQYKDVTVGNAATFTSDGNIVLASSDLITISGRSPSDLSICASGNTNQIYFETGGNVGIGTSAPLHLLDVSGAVVAQSLEGRAEEPLSLYGTDGQRKLRTFTASNGMVLGLGDDTPSSDDLIRLDARSASPNASWMNSGPFAVGATGFPGLNPKFMVVDSTNIAGQVLLANTVTDSTTKYGGIMSPHYDNSEEPLRLIAGGVGAVTSNVYIGGGLDGNTNAATDISFFTATGQTTQVGSERMKIDNSGNVMVGLTTGKHRFSVEVGDNDEYAASIVNNGGDGKGLFIKTFGGPLEEYPILDLENTEGNVFRVQSNGHVGIRMASVDSTPNYPLTIGKNAAVQTGTLATSDFCSWSARSLTRAAHFGLFGRGTTDGVGYISWNVDNGANHYIWTDNVGILRTSTTQTDVGAQLGDVIGDQTSDERLKDIKSGFSYGLDEVNLLNPVKYSLKNHSGLFSGGAPEYLGLLAQEVSGIVPQVVKESNACVDGYTSGERNSPDNILRINYGEMVPVLVKAIQELSAKVEELESRLDS